MRAGFTRIIRDQRGGAAIEFGLLGPVFIALLLGVLQIGVGMQSYNAVRNITTDVARATMIEYSTGNKLSKEQIRTATISTATSAPYLLDPQTLSVAVYEPTNQRVGGATEIKVRLRYEVPTFLNLMGWKSPTIEHTRPIFVIDDTA